MRMIIFFVMLISLSYMALAGTITPYPAENPYGASEAWSLDDTNVSLVGKTTGTIEGCTFNADTPFSSGKSLSCDGNDNSYFDTNVLNYSTADSVAIIFWIKPSSPSDGDRVFGNDDAGANARIFLVHENLGVANQSAWMYQEGDYIYISHDYYDALWSETDWAMITLLYDGYGDGSMHLYYDGWNDTTKIASSYVLGSDIAAVYDWFFMAWNNDGVDGNNFPGYLDQPMIFTHIPSNGTLETIFRGNYSIEAFNTSILSPVDNGTASSVPIDVIFTTGADSNCTLYADNGTGFIPIESNVSTSADENTTLQHSPPSPASFNITYYVRCQTSNYVSNSSNVTILYDSDYPGLSTSPATNGSTVTTGNVINATCSDANLLDFEGSLWLGSTLKHHFSYIATDKQALTMNVSLNSTYQSGSYLWHLNCSDGHTDNDIDSIVTTAYADRITYEHSGVMLTEKIKMGVYSKISSLKLSDRYITIIEFSDAKLNSITKSYSCSVPFKDVKNTEYDFHKVCGRMWVDENSGNPAYERKIGVKNFEVDTYTNDNVLVTKSVGLINIVNLSLQFYIDVTHPSINITLPINMTSRTAGTEVVINYTAYDSSGVDNCTLHVSGNTTYYDDTITSPDAFRISFAGVGVYLYNVSCIDVFGLSNVSNSKYINISAPYANPTPLFSCIAQPI